MCSDFDLDAFSSSGFVGREKYYRFESNCSVLRPPNGGSETNFVASSSAFVIIPTGMMNPNEICSFSLTVRNFLLIESETVTLTVTQRPFEEPNALIDGPANGLWWRARVCLVLFHVRFNFDELRFNHRSNEIQLDLIGFNGI